MARISFVAVLLYNTPLIVEYFELNGSTSIDVRDVQMERHVLGLL